MKVHHIDKASKQERTQGLQIARKMKIRLKCINDKK